MVYFSCFLLTLLHEESYTSRVKVFNVWYMLQIVKGWVKELTRQRGYTDQMVEDANAVIYTFGSYRLGVSFLL